MKKEMNKITVEEVKRLVSLLPHAGGDYTDGLTHSELAHFFEQAASLCIEQAEELSSMSNIIAGLNQRLFDAYKQRDEFGELIGILKVDVEKWKNQARRSVEQTERVTESQGELRDMAYADVEQLRTENERLRDALEPLAIIGRLPTVRRHSDAGLWAQSSNEDSEVIRLMSIDAINAADILSQCPAPAKEDKTNGGWLPIESAPRDGSDILGCVKISKTTAGHKIGGDIKIAKSFFHSDYYGQIWIRQTGDQFFPTHWMPLPQPPIDDKQG